MISEMRKNVKFYKEDILSLQGSNTRECIGFYPYSALSQDTYLTNKYNHFKKQEAALQQIIIEMRIKHNNIISFDKY